MSAEYGADQIQILEGLEDQCDHQCRQFYYCH